MLERLRTSAVRFGEFQLNLQSGELHKHGIRLRLPRQSLTILATLLERQGEIVTREELQKTLWPEDTFVDFEHSVNSAVKRLREALNDSADNPRFVETLPRLGYRYIGPPVSQPESMAVSQVVDPSISPEAPARARELANSWWRIGIVAAGLAVLTAALGIARLLPRRTSHAFTEEDSVVLADFDNTTGEGVFDGALKEGLAVQLAQSPFLHFVPEDRVRETLRFMGHPSEKRLLPPLVREVCERVNAKAFVAGSIGRLGTHYVLAVDAVNCQNGGALARAQAEVQSQDQVLQALGHAAQLVRRGLGESLSSIQRYDVSIQEASTSSLQALKAYSLGEEERARGAELEAIPLFANAIKLDPKFAMAYARMAAAYNNLGESQKAGACLKEAFDLREHVTEREKLYLEIRYYQIVTGETDKAAQTYEFWTQVYPREWTPYNGLAARYQVVGQYDKAVENAITALKLAPDNILPYANLALSYRSLNRFAEAKEICEKAIAAKRDSSYTHAVSFEIGFILGDQAAMQHEIEWARGTPREADMLTAEALTEIYAGRLRSARRLFQSAHDSARKEGLQENAAFSMTWEALAEADLGNFQQARDLVKKAMALGNGIDAQETAAEALAISGDLQKAEALAEDLYKRFSEHTPLNTVSLPTIRATIALRRGNPARAIDLLRPSIPYDLSEFSSLAAVYVRGHAYLSARSGKEAAGEFQKVLDHSGIAPTSPRHALARLQLGRAYTVAGDRTKARAAYRDFLTLWKDADPDIPILIAAKAEYAKLQ
jgi:tetratricopeptide (TPR) repeat protein/DNA-binding winged helix-turn-helix (wHTH) protein